MYLALCLAAILFAAHAPADQRRAASVVALGLLANWMVCGWAYTAPAIVQRHAVDLWTIADLTFGLFALWHGYRHWWGWALWGSTIIQQCLHVTHAALGATHYLDALDGLLRAQIAVFLLLGGKGIADLIYRAVDRGRHVRRSSDPAFQKHRP